ncbi:MAG TPA: sigma 54-interacting transcriptional regulator [Clostridiales bacterium]|nr:sigma 54-interacting transcriptional regulator [Clostridiales bacterium]
MKTEARTIKQKGEMVTVYEYILNHSDAGVYITDAAEKIVWVNNVILSHENCQLEQLVGRQEQEVWPDMMPSGYNRFSGLTESPAKEFLLSFFNCNGKKCDILTRSYPFYLDGKLKYICSIGHNTDYSDRQIARILDFRKKHLQEKQTFANGTSYTFDSFIGNDVKVREMIDIAKRVALKESTVLICGPTGTGKEIMAQAIHNGSLQREGRFVGVNCAAIPENLLETMVFGSVKGAFTGAVDSAGLIEEAAGGTLFLDEINSMPWTVQGKLLRVLQERKFTRVGSNREIKVNCRFISATNQAPQQLVAENILRQDLYYRLAAVTLTVPALYSRKGDLPLLLKHFLESFNNKYQMNIKDCDDRCKELLYHYSWPGNVRELEHVVEYMMNVTVEKKILSYVDLPSYFDTGVTFDGASLPRPFTGENAYAQIMADFERKLIIEALGENDYNISRTARSLQMRRENLYYRMKRLDIPSKL